MLDERLGGVQVHDPKSGYQPQWRATAVSGDFSKTLPPTKCSIAYHVDGDDRVLRGELITMLRLMRRSLRKNKHVNVFEFPVPPVSHLIHGLDLIRDDSHRRRS